MIPPGGVQRSSTITIKVIELYENSHKQSHQNSPEKRNKFQRGYETQTIHFGQLLQGSVPLDIRVVHLEKPRNKLQQRWSNKQMRRFPPGLRGFQNLYDSIYPETLDQRLFLKIILIQELVSHEGKNRVPAVNTKWTPVHRLRCYASIPEQWTSKKHLH